MNLKALGEAKRMTQRVSKSTSPADFVSQITKVASTHSFSGVHLAYWHL